MTMRSQTKRELVNIRRTLKVLVRTLQGIDEAIHKLLQVEHSYQPSKNALMTLIIEHDIRGINLDQGSLKEASGLGDKFENELLNLLKIGEVYQIQDKVYPLDSINQKFD